MSISELLHRTAIFDLMVLVLPFLKVGDNKGSKCLNVIPQSLRVSLNLLSALRPEGSDACSVGILLLTKRSRIFVKARCRDEHSAMSTGTFCSAALHLPIYP